MNFNWNVYKVFKNGNRAKAPITTFESEEHSAEEHFNNVIKKSFSGKFADANYQIVRADLPQQDNLISEEEKFSKQKNRVLGILIRNKGGNLSKKYGAGLVYSKESDWKWQWAILEPATNNYIEGLSPKFNSYEGAQVWITEKITDISTGM